MRASCSRSEVSNDGGRLRATLRATLAAHRRLFSNNSRRSSCEERAVFSSAIAVGTRNRVPKKLVARQLLSGLENVARDRLRELRLESPFPAYAVPRAWVWIEEFRHRVADDFAPNTLDEFIAQWRAGAAVGTKSWAVIRDDEIGGVITARRLSPIVADAHCIFARRFWGRETTLASLRLVFDELYRDGVEKIISLVFKDNHGVIGIIKALGGTVEGRLARHTLRGGKRVDMVPIGILKEAFYGVISGRSDQRDNGRSAAAADDDHQLVKRLEHQQHGELGDIELSAEPNAVPGGASGAAVQHSYERDGESGLDHGAGREHRDKPGQ